MGNICNYEHHDYHMGLQKQGWQGTAFNPCIATQVEAHFDALSNLPEQLQAFRALYDAGHAFAVIKIYLNDNGRRKYWGALAKSGVAWNILVHSLPVGDSKAFGAELYIRTVPNAQVAHCLRKQFVPGYDGALKTLEEVLAGHAEGSTEAADT